MSRDIANVPTTWPFQVGEAVYYVNGMRETLPPAPVPAVIVRVCERWRTYHWASVSILRSDKVRPSKVHCATLVYRGYCPRCEVPAHADGSRLFCPTCGADVRELPPPDDLVIRWFPFDDYSRSMAMHRAALDPSLTWSQAKAASDETLAATYAAALARLGITEPETRSTSDFDGTYDIHRINEMRYCALVGNDAGLLAAHDAILNAPKTIDTAAMYDKLAELGLMVVKCWKALKDEEADDLPPLPRPGRPVLLPLPERTADDAEPDGADDLTRWLTQQFGRKAA
jgi:hypothetical protein